MTPIPETALGAVYVATNKKINLGIEGTQTLFKADVGGYYVIHKDEWHAILELAKNAR